MEEKDKKDKYKWLTYTLGISIDEDGDIWKQVSKTKRERLEEHEIMEYRKRFVIAKFLKSVAPKGKSIYDELDDYGNRFSNAEKKSEMKALFTLDKFCEMLKINKVGKDKYQLKFKVLIDDKPSYFDTEIVSVNLLEYIKKQFAENHKLFDDFFMEPEEEDEEKSKENGE